MDSDIKRLMELAGMKPATDLLEPVAVVVETDAIEETPDIIPDDRLGKPTPTPQAVAQDHDVSLDDIMDELRRGMQVELEHVDDIDLAMEIALDHLAERPDYYTQLQYMEELPVEEADMFGKEEKPYRKIVRDFAQRHPTLKWSPMEMQSLEEIVGSTLEGGVSDSHYAEIGKLFTGKIMGES